MVGQWARDSNRGPPNGPTPPRRNPARRWWVLGTVVFVVAVAVAAGVVITARRSPDSSAPGSASPRPSLVAADLLLSDRELGAVMKTSMADERPTGDLPATGVTVTPGKCTGAFDPFDSLTMAQVTSSYTMATQNVVELPRADRRVAQAATIFALSTEARVFFNRQTVAWMACAGGALTAYFRRADKTQHYTVANPVVTADLSTLVFGNDQRQCQRAIGVKIDVVVDVRACGPTIGSEGATIATDMLAKIP